MKLQIDTEVKTITIEETINIGELFELLCEMFPNFQWKDYLLVPVRTIQYWKDPVTIPWNPQPWINPPYTPMYPLVSPGTNPMPWSFPTVTCGTSSSGVGYNTPGTSIHNLIIEKK
jgi:hypothetical protein